MPKDQLETTEPESTTPKALAPANGYALAEDNARMRSALERIARWFGEFPPTGKTWYDGTPMSYGAAYGSNGERDYMRAVAQEALSAHTCRVSHL